MTRVPFSPLRSPVTLLHVQRYSSPYLTCCLTFPGTLTPMYLEGPFVSQRHCSETKQTENTTKQSTNPSKRGGKSVSQITYQDLALGGKVLLTQLRHIPAPLLRPPSPDRGENSVCHQNTPSPLHSRCWLSWPVVLDRLMNSSASEHTG